MPFSFAAAAIPAITAVAGAVSGGSSNQSTQTQTNSAAPWDPQGQALALNYQDAGGLYHSRQDTPLSGYYAGMSPEQIAATQGVIGTANNANGVGGYGTQISIGNDLINQSGNYIGNANNIAANGIGNQNQQLSGLLSNYATTGQLPGQSGTNPALSQGVTNAALGSLGSLGQGAGIANQVAAQGLNTAGAMQNTLNGAAAYSNNPTINGQIDALGSDISRNLNNTTLTGIRSAAMANGNTNSSREGALEAIAGSQAQQNLLNSASQIRANAYNTGAGLANSQWSTGLQAAGGAANSLTSNGSIAGSLANTQQGLNQNQSQFDTTSRLNAANSQQSQNLGFQTADTQAQLAANSQIGNQVGLGYTGMSSGLQGQANSAATVLAANNSLQQQQQALLSAQDQRGQSILNDYFNISSRGFNGANSTTGTTTGSSGGGLTGALQGAVGGGLAGYSGLQQLTGNSDPFGLKNSVYNAFNPAPAGGTAGGAGTSTLQSLGLFNPLT